jgi:hypothetical protein
VKSEPAVGRCNGMRLAAPGHHGADRARHQTCPSASVSAARGMLLLLILPVIISTSFLLVADIDSPRDALISILPHNLIAMTHALEGA